MAVLPAIGGCADISSAMTLSVGRAAPEIAFFSKLSDQF
jgi:hypothetical protein